MKRPVISIIILLLSVSAPVAAEKETKKAAKDPRTEEIRGLKLLKMKLALENAIAAERLKKVLREMHFQHKKLSLENQLKMQLQKREQLKQRKEMARLQLEMVRLKKRITALKLKSAQDSARLNSFRTGIALRNSRKKAAMMVRRVMMYSRYPFKKGILTISDRRIALNGPIIRGVADYVTRRIHFFNNLNREYPIFLVIDICPGGSVMEGYRILKAMQASRAPVYVVVKSFAASMAAVITTLAEKSFAYPNAVILHHQMSTINWGNMTEITEQLKVAREWERRLHQPVAAKMGISPKEFVRRMYKNNSRGDWEEFANRAKRLKWVDHVVKGVEEHSLTDKPGDKNPVRRRRRWVQAEKKDSSGSRYIRLPRLSPFDFYFIYNPDKYYR